LQTGEKECINKIDLLIIIWKWTPWSMYVLKRSYFKCAPPRPIEKPELTMHAGIMMGISPDDWSLDGATCLCDKTL